MVVAKRGELKKTVLVLGDGDFAFSARLASAGLFFVTATTVESEADLEARYPDSFPKHRAQVNTCGGRCLFGVDARELGSSTAPYVHFSESFDRLVWHNPYTEGADLQTHRSLAAKRVHNTCFRIALRGTYGYCEYLRNYLFNSPICYCNQEASLIWVYVQRVQT